MQLIFPWLRPPGPRAPRSTTPTIVQIGTQTFPVSIVRHRGARRYVLRLTPAGGLRLTVPRGASIAGGLAFAKRQGPWIAREQARRMARERAWGEDGEVWFRGNRVPWPAGETRAQFETRARAIASDELPQRCLALAREHALSVSRVTIRNQRSRWGSCSARGAIALNWRLVQMPPEVSDYVILHELMHLRQPNHSRRFWREVESVCEHWRESERWLRQHGRELL